MRSRALWSAALLAATVLLAIGCMYREPETSIPPLSDAGERIDPGLGPEAQPLSSGPGYKGSPSWSPHGGRVAFTVDGYVVDKPVGTGAVRRWTTRDFVAEDVEWTSESSLAILGVVWGEKSSSSIYRARSGEESLGVREVAAVVLAMSRGPEGDGLVVAFRAGNGESELALPLKDSRPSPAPTTSGPATRESRASTPAPSGAASQASHSRRTATKQRWRCAPPEAPSSCTPSTSGRASTGG